jgi:hypothetical protein
VTAVELENAAGKVLRQELIAKCEGISSGHLEIFLAAVEAIKHVDDNEGICSRTNGSLRSGTTSAMRTRATPGCASTTSF